MHPFLKGCVQSHKTWPSSKIKLWYFADCRWLLTLTGLHELTLTPKHLGERAAAAGEHLLHGRIPPGGESSFVCRKRKCTEGQPPSVEMSRLLHWSNPLLSLPHNWLLKSQMKPPHDLPYAFPRAVICFLQLPPHWLQISPVSHRLRCR